MLAFLFTLGQTITLQLRYLSLCLVKGPANAGFFKTLQKTDTDRLIAHSTSSDQSDHFQVRL